MITAIEAKDISDNLNSQKSKECLKQIDCRVRKVAAESYTEVEISDLKPVRSVLLYLESLGYFIKTITEEKYNTPLSIKLQW
jgi:hypothetical protein